MLEKLSIQSLPNQNEIQNQNDVFEKQIILSQNSISEDYPTKESCEELLNNIYNDINTFKEGMTEILQQLQSILETSQLFGMSMTAEQLAAELQQTSRNLGNLNVIFTKRIGFALIALSVCKEEGHITQEQYDEVEQKLKDIRGKIDEWQKKLKEQLEKLRNPSLNNNRTHSREIEMLGEMLKPIIWGLGALASIINALRGGNASFSH